MFLWNYDDASLNNGLSFIFIIAMRINRSIRRSLIRTWSCNMTYKSSQHRWKSLYKNQYPCDFQSYTIDSPFYQRFSSFSTFNFISMADDCIIWIRCSVSCDQHDFEFKVIFIWRFHNAQIFKIINDRRFNLKIYFNRSVSFYGSCVFDD